MKKLWKKYGGRAKWFALQVAVALNVGFMTLSLPRPAHASIGTIINNILADIKQAPTLLAWIFFIVGIFASGHGLLNWWKQSKSGGHGQITGNQIVIEIAVGALLIFITAWILNVGETLGVQGGGTLSRPTI